MDELANVAKAIESQRHAVHGSFTMGHTLLGRTWAALLSEHLQVEVQDLPPHVVELLLTALKLHRASRPFRRSEDDYLDGLNYLRFAAQDSKLYSYGKPPPPRSASVVDTTA